ncbi:putative lipoprotein [Plesiocystis pacifica SIR-1]|uniref:Putative lipoprotein n=1 Tax=Plesiocystis pacifica SIR-1 TaxID=391625 RepID=A6FZ82_9BACT|nr:DUF4215 domain-containing protein [Plesiocystis pacifica]EDM80966.1 putative lipoprotein [Plesiocystis pacifica SIR-1]
MACPKSSIFGIALGLGLGLSLTACPSSTPSGDDEVGEDTAATDTASTLGTDSSGSSGESSDTASTTDTDSTTDTANTTDSTTGNGSECGNGILEQGEQCDDGNTVDDDGCQADCTFPPGPIECGGQVYACGDEIDNDRDGKVDLDDPECISPCDDNESSFQTDLPGQNNDCKADCYFDSNSGSGDDKCEWNLKCDPENPGAEIGCEYDPEFNPAMCMVQLEQDCLDFCVPNVPNGCDCFGCCEVDGQFIYLDSSPNCSLDNLDGCQNCTFYEDCANPCVPEECELCFGQDPSELDEDCEEPSCPEGFDSCINTADCPEGFFCSTGCCYPIDIE